MKSENRQTMILIGVALLVVAGLLFYIGYSQPRVYEEETVSYSETESVTNQPREEISKGVNDAGDLDGDDEKAQQVYSYPINLNTATYEELMSIDGIGEARASAILEYRDYIGKYTSVEQIKDIEGISDEIYNDVAGYLTV